MNPPRILVVDDDALSLALLEATLRAAGYAVYTAGDGFGALGAVADLQPDLVLLDVVMPGQDGIEVCRQLKSDRATRLVPLILVTGLSDIQDRLAGIEAGADAFLTKPFEPRELLARVRSLMRHKAFTDELDHGEEVICALARSIEGKDPCTRNHCERLSIVAADLGRRLGLPPPEILALERAGFVHDIGKVAIPDQVLLKPGPLTPAEWELVRQHPVVGERICQPLRSLRLTLPIIRHHHERLDGSGYPDGLVGDRIPLSARVLQVVDIYDALISERPYKPALPSGMALDILRLEVEKGWIDSTIVETFAALMAQGMTVQVEE
jgi:putative two-component system response regulator